MMGDEGGEQDADNPETQGIAGPAGGLRDVQKKTFTKWINSQLDRNEESRARASVTDLYYDLRDGRVLLEVLEILTKKKLPRERGSLKIHHLGNVNTALKAIRNEQKVSLLNISAGDIVDGNPKMTLALVWNIVLCFQFHKGMKALPLPDMERALLTWCQKTVFGYSPVVSITSFTKSFKDGLAFNFILHKHKPNLFDIDMILSKSPLSRLDFAFQMYHQHFGLARLLDPEDVHLESVDKQSVMTYIMCIYQVMPHKDDEERIMDKTATDATSVPKTSTTESLSKPSTPSRSVVSSPLKVPPKFVTLGKFYNYDSYDKVYQDVLAWVVKASDELKAMDDVGLDLQTVNIQSETTFKYLEDLNKFHHAIGEVLKVGVRLLEGGLNTSEANDVRVKGKLLNDEWESLRSGALRRQKDLCDKLMALQQREIQTLSEWMTEIEDRISRMGKISGDLALLSNQEKEHSNLQKDLETQLPLVESVTNFIYFDSDTSPNSPTDQPDLEGQVMAQGERWQVICSWVDDRSIALQLARLQLESIESDKTALHQFMKRVEEELRKMELNTTNQKQELIKQTRAIKNIEVDLRSEQLRLARIDKTSEDICSNLDMIMEDRENILRSVEAFQDRWEILTEILEAQRNRISSFGIDLDQPWEDELESSTTNDGDGSGCLTDETASKKRKMTGTKRIEFETAVAKISHWISTNSHGLSKALRCNLSSTDDLILTNFQEEYATNKANILQTIAMGEVLVEEIKSEADYPPGYLKNVTEKVESLKTQARDIEFASHQLREKVHYHRSKSNLYGALDYLQQIMKDNQIDISSMNITAMSDDDLALMILEIDSRKSSFESQSDRIEELRGLAGETCLHPGAEFDPDNTIKSDVVKFCEAWHHLEDDFSNLLTLLRETKSSRSANEESINLKVDNDFISVLFVDDVHVMEDRLCKMKVANGDEEKVADFEELLNLTKKFNEEVDGLVVWMKEVETFLTKESTPSDDLDTLDAQLKESSGLLDDFSTLQPTVDAINELGLKLLLRARPASDFSLEFESRLSSINSQWEGAAIATREQCSNLQATRAKLESLSDGINEIESFSNHVGAEVPPVVPVTRPDELSKLTFKLLHLRDKIERKKLAVEQLESRMSETSERHKLRIRWKEVKTKWDSICVPVIERYHSIKMASQDYGEFKTLAAQEKDWLERLEKKLNRSLNTAADAEEISEELVDIENFIRHHPDKRLSRIQELSKLLTEQNILLTAVIQDAQKLETRWNDLSTKARQRTALLEGSIAEAQEWELKIISVQEWLSERDMVLSSHLDHDLTVDDLPDETQLMLREFEDQENLLAELDEQVDAYRSAGKLEAAARLEDQLDLIHGRFQELSMKFELFQQHPAKEFEPHLNRVARQLRDIGDKVCLTELASSELEGIEGQLNHATCIMNALSDIKPEVENVIKMGRKIVETDASVEDKEKLSRKIDQLKKDFNQTGSDVADAKENLEKAHVLSKDLNLVMTSLRDWLSSQIKDLNGNPSEDDRSKLMDVAKELVSTRKSDAETILEIRCRFYEMCSPSILTGLIENIQSLSEKWSELAKLLEDKIASHDDSANILETVGKLGSNNPFQAEERKTSSVGGPDDGPLLEEFRSAFQEVSQLIESAEMKLHDSGRSADCALDEEIEELRPKIGNLRNLAEKLVKMFVGQKSDVEPEMEILGQRWNEIVRDVEERLAMNKPFKMVEVENIKTTISHMRVPACETLVTSNVNDEDEEIVTLPETGFSPSKPPSPQKRQRQGDTNGKYVKKATFGKEAVCPILSSGESSPDFEAIESRLPPRPSSAGEKIPPKTLPKPEWYLRARKNSPGATPPLLSPERVKVVVSSLPSPQRIASSTPQMVVVTTAKVELGPQQQVAQREVFPSSTSPSSCSPLSETPSNSFGRTSTKEQDDDFMDDEELARDSAAIDRLLLEAKADLAEVSRKVSKSNRSSDANYDKLLREALDFENSASCMVVKMNKAGKTMNELDVESDLKLRQDLIDMEYRMLEAEVATIISRGDTLVMLADRHDIGRSQDIQITVDQLRQIWTKLKQQADRKKQAAKSYEDRLYKFRSEVNDLKTWLGHTLRQTTWARANNLDRQTAEKLKAEANYRRSKLKELNETAASLKEHSSLGGQELALTVLNSDWEELERKLNVLTRDDEEFGASLSNESPQQKSKGPAGQISARIEKMRDIVGGIDRQLSDPVLSGKQFENLRAQAEALDIIKLTLEKLKTNSKKIEVDMEVLYGTLSMEYFEKITGQLEKLRKETERVNQKFVDRQEAHRKCTTRRKDLDYRHQNLLEFFESVPNRKTPFLNSETSAAGKNISDYAILVKEIQTRTSTDESCKIQQQHDSIMQKWQEFLRQVAESRASSSSSKDLEKLTQWLDSSLLTLQKPVQFNDLVEVQDYLQTLETIYNELSSKRDLASQMNDASITTRTVRAGIERLSAALPKRIQFYNDKMEKIESFILDLNAMEEFREDAQALFDEVRHDVSKNEVLNNLNLSVENKHNEVSAKLANYIQLEKEAKNPDLSRNVQMFKEQWLKLRSQLRLSLTSMYENSLSNQNGEAQKNGNILGSTPSISSFETTHETQASRTTYYNSQASFMTEEADPSSPYKSTTKEVIENPLRDFELFVNEPLKMEKLPVHETTAIRGAISHHMAALRAVDAQKALLDKVSLKDISSDEERQVLMGKMKRLRDQFDERKHQILSRKSECNAMAGDSDQLVRKAKEIDEWLTELEAQLEKIGPLGSTVDVIEEQQEVVLNALKKISKYNHHVLLFAQMCQRIITNYPKDDTSEIELCSRDFTTRYSTLSEKFNALKTNVQKVRHSFSSFDKSVTHFLGWLSEMESNVDNLEFQVENTVEGKSNLPVILDDIKREILAKDREFNALSRFGDKILRSLNADERVVLAQRLTEVSQRWKDLQNKMLNLGCVVGSASSPSLSAQHRIPTVHAALRDHQDWVLRKRRELESLSLGKDFNSLQKQLDENLTFRDQLKDRGVQINNSLETARELQAGLIDTQGFQETASNLKRDFSALVLQAENWDSNITEALVPIKSFEDELKKIEIGVKNIESKEMLTSNGLEALEPGIHKEELAEISMVAKALARKIDELKTHPAANTQSANHRLHTLTARLMDISETVEIREKNPSPNAIPQVHPSDAFLSFELPKGWERAFTEDDVPYYIHHDREETHWDHPELITLMTDILELNMIKFSAYRLASKLRSIQKKLQLDLLDIEVAHRGFEEHKLTSDRHEMAIKVPEMIIVLSSFYETLKIEEGSEEIDVKLCTELALNWILNIYDPGRTGQVRVFSFKLAVLVFCRGPLTEKYIHLFNLAAASNPNKKVDPRQLGLLIFDCIQIPKLLGEVAAFGGSNVEPSVRSCFMMNVAEDKDAAATMPADIDCKHFLRWVKREPQSLVWFPVLQRFSSAENARHYVKCGACKTTPLIGFRYRCVKCFNVDLCQSCFFVGNTAKGHKSDHPMKEHCTSTGRGENLKFLGQSLRNSFRSNKYFKKQQRKLSYLPVNSVLEGEDYASPIMSPNLSMESRDFLNVKPAKLPQRFANSVDIPKSEEHDLIAKYCHHLHSQEISKNGTDGLNETNDDVELDDVFDTETDKLEDVIRDLEAKQRDLLQEQENLTHELSLINSLDNSLKTESQIRENKKKLKQDTLRMETRATILKDHNLQLEAQLARLRQLMNEQPSTCAEMSISMSAPYGTLQSKSVVAADLHVDEHSKETRLNRRMPPPALGRLKSQSNGTDDGASTDSVSSMGDTDYNNRNSHSSLDLSDHETQRESD